MALYAFDGTLNSDDPEDKKADSNVVRIRDVYDGEVVYEEGVGLRFGLLGRFFGGSFGAGGEARVKEAYDKLQKIYDEGDRDIDIVGYSRGAALALDFANLINKKGLKGPDGGRIDSPPIRFLGLFDTVASFGIPINLGIPFHRINFGKNLKVPPNAVHCYHAMALNERRQAFRPTRLDPNRRLDQVLEVWFKGIHSDVGGGANLGLTSITLSWMFRRGVECGLSFKASAVEEAEALRDVSVAPGVNKTDPIENSLRKIFPTDLVHASAVTPAGLANTEEELKITLPKLEVENG